MKADRPYLEHIVDSISAIEGFIAGGRDEFLEKRLIQDAVIRNFEIIGEPQPIGNHTLIRTHLVEPRAGNPAEHLFYPGMVIVELRSRVQTLHVSEANGIEICMRIGCKRLAGLIEEEIEAAIGNGTDFSGPRLQIE